MIETLSTETRMRLAKRARQGCDHCQGTGIAVAVDELLIEYEFCRCLADPRGIGWALQLVRAAARRDLALTRAQAALEKHDAKRAGRPLWWRTVDTLTVWAMRLVLWLVGVTLVLRALEWLVTR